MLDAARLRRSPMVDMEAGAASGEAAGEARGELLDLGFAGERKGESERKLRSAAAAGEDVPLPPADGEEPPESREAGLGFALGAALDLGFGFGLGLGLEAAAAGALAFLIAAGFRVGGVVW